MVWMGPFTVFMGRSLGVRVREARPFDASFDLTGLMVVDGFHAGDVGDVGNVGDVGDGERSGRTVCPTSSMVVSPWFMLGGANDKTKELKRNGSHCLGH